MGCYFKVKVKVKSILFPQLHKHRTYTWGTETLLGLFVPSFDTSMIILLDNPYAGVTLISKNKLQSGVSWANRPISKIPQCTPPTPHNAPHRNRNVYIPVPRWHAAGYGTGASRDPRQWPIHQHDSYLKVIGHATPAATIRTTTLHPISRSRQKLLLIHTLTSSLCQGMVNNCISQEIMDVIIYLCPTLCWIELVQGS